MALKDKDRSGMKPNGQSKEQAPASPVCYANSEEVREEFRDELPKKKDKF